MNLLNITEAPAENLAGLDNIVYIGLVADAASIPVKHAVDVLLDPTVWVNLATPPVMKTGKKMVSIRVTPDSIKFDADGQGELDGKSIKNKLEFSIPGLTDENLALVSATNNADLFFIFSHNGQYHLMGNKERPANAESPKGTSGGKDSPIRRTGLW